MSDVVSVVISCVLFLTLTVGSAYLIKKHLDKTLPKDDKPEE